MLVESGSLSLTVLLTTFVPVSSMPSCNATQGNTVSADVLHDCLLQAKQWHVVSCADVGHHAGLLSSMTCLCFLLKAQLARDETTVFLSDGTVGYINSNKPSFTHAMTQLVEASVVFITPR